MVVEDHDDSRAMMRIMIESYGYDVIEARDGLEAVEAVKSECPGLVLMDVNMPRLDGLSAAIIIKGMDNCSDVPIVAVTAFSDFRDQALESGCVDVLPKPVEFLHLKEVIETHLT